MAVDKYDPIKSFEDWYIDYEPEGGRDGCLAFKSVSPCGGRIFNEFLTFKREMDARVSNFEVCEKVADGEVITRKPDLPNISSGETAGIVRRIARNLVQNAPNVEVISKFDDDDPYGIFSRHVLLTKIVGSDLYSNDMQQNLFASTKTSLTVGFSCVIPALLSTPKNGWYIKYDSIHYRDVFPEPGAKDIRDAEIVYIRRYLTKGEIAAIVRNNTPGWDIQALKKLMENSPGAREAQSAAYQDVKHKRVPDGYAVITRYDSTGNDFVTFDERTKLLLRLEKNKHPLHEHPVHFLILEKDDQQPLGKSQVELLIGRQDFQDLMLNGAMKLWYRNINPTIIGYGAPNATPNLSPGKYTQISNPNAKIEAFEVNTQTLMQYGSISQQNLGSMVNLVGSADQQMATQAGGGMSATPQGVDAQQAMVDITTNNYQKAIESFFSHYCSYALTIYFQELKATEKVTLTADARVKLLEAQMPLESFNEDGTLDIDFEKLAVEYFVRCVPGSLTELEDEKQLRVLNQLFVPLSQSMPALAAAQDTDALKNASKAMSYIIAKQIELSGSTSAKEIGVLWKTGDVDVVNERDARIQRLEDGINGVTQESEAQLDLTTNAIAQLQEQMSLMAENQRVLMEKLGVFNQPSESETGDTPEQAPEDEAIPV